MLIGKNKPKLILLSETRTVENMTVNELKIDDYICFRCNAPTRFTGGVAIYVHNSISAYEIYKYNENNIWAIAIQVVSGFVKEIFCVLYRGHKSTNENFLTFFEEMCNKLVDISSKINICGDFNYDFFKCPATKKVMRLVKSFNLKQLQKTPTREDQFSSSTIDWFLTNNKNVKCDVAKNEIITDHKILIINFFNNCKSKLKTKLINDYSNYSKNVLLTKMSEIEWHEIEKISDINIKSYDIINSLKNIVDSVVGKKLLKLNYACKWFNDDLKKLKDEKIIAYNMWKNDKNILNQKIYKDVRNKYRKSLNDAESNYIQNQLKANKYDSKKLWRIMKSCYSDNDNDSLNAVKFNDEILTNNIEIADRVNKYFVESIEELVSKIPCVSVSHVKLPNVPQCKFEFESVSIESVSEVVKLLQKKNFIDNISGRVLNDAINCMPFLTCLTSLINDSMSSGCVPKNFKNSVIVPIRKVKNSNNHSDLRPINQLPVYNKILEMVVRRQLNNYFESNNLFIPEQSGFRSNYSCESALNFLLHEWKVSLDNRRIIVSVFIDLKRAFETIDRSLLIVKLKCYGCSSRVIEWFESYLNERKQCTKFNDTLSEEIDNGIGIPQGGTLSCLLFLIFINDMKLCLQNVKIKLFADDTLLYVECSDVEEGIKLMNNDLKNIFNYLCLSKLVINTSKSKAMIIAHKHVNVGQSVVKINGEKLEYVDEIKYLGIVIDNKLNFNSWTDHICANLMKKFYVLKRCANKLNYNSKLLYYKSLVLPSVDYCSSLLFSCNNSQINKMQLIQNRYMRLILKTNYETRISDMLENLHIMSIKQRVYFNTMIYMHKLASGNGPDYLTSKLVKRNEMRERRLRSDSEYHIINSKKSILHDSFLVKGLKLYNVISSQFSKVNNVNFKMFLYDYLISNCKLE